MASPKLQKLPLAKLKSFKLPSDIKAQLRADILNGKGYDACHRRIKAQTGIWIPELVPVFKQLDRILGLPKA